MTPETLVHFTVDRGIATITLDNPDKRNALSAALVQQLDGHLLEAITHDDVTAIVLTGTGTVFCAGADLTEAGTSPPVSFADVLTRVWTSPKPTLCRVNGHARAGGIGLLAACDVVVAPASASFAFTEVRIGVSPAMIAVVCLRVMTPRAAKRYLLTGETFDAGAAADAGLITMAVPDDELDSATERVVDAFRRGERHALAVTKDLIATLPDASFEQGLARASAVSATLFQSDAAAEGIASFREKRLPRWAVDAGIEP